MQSHKLVLDEVAHQPFRLIAIHSHIEDFKLAFILNKNLHLRLSRTRNDVDLYQKSKRSLFTLYGFDDYVHYCKYYLVSNTSIEQSATSSGTNSLFDEQEMAIHTTYLLPELKKVDFFLKIEEEAEAVNEMHFIKNIVQIPQIETAYAVPNDNIKSKENLIFD